jgi:hypothetical protein
MLIMRVSKTTILVLVMHLKCKELLEASKITVSHAPSSQENNIIETPIISAKPSRG